MAQARQASADSIHALLASVEVAATLRQPHQVMTACNHCEDSPHAKLVLLFRVGGHIIAPQHSVSISKPRACSAGDKDASAVDAEELINPQRVPLRVAALGAGVPSTTTLASTLPGPSPVALTRP